MRRLHSTCHGGTETQVYDSKGHDESKCREELSHTDDDVIGLGYGSVIERYQARDDMVERYRQGSSANSVYLDSVTLTDEEVSARVSDQSEEVVHSSAVPATMPPLTRLAEGMQRKVGSQVHAVAPKDSSLKLYHVMSVKQTLREDLAECAYQFSCRAADWTRSDLHVAPMQFEPLELHVIDALGQQEVPDYFQQPAKAVTEDVSVMRGPYAQEWIAAVLEEIESFKRLGVYEEVPKGSATKPNIHGGPARKKARIVICGNFQDVHPDEFTASKTPSYPALRTWDGQWNAGMSLQRFSTRAYLETET